MRRYHRKEWLAFRREIFELDGRRCVRCNRGPDDGVVLQVHHKRYRPGHLPWQYAYEDCETLCKGCHASEHGIVQPFLGWVIEGYDDLGALDGQCELCGTPIRHVFIVSHDKWPTLEVGEVCCDHLTSTTDASEHLGAEKRHKARRERFVRSPQWKLDGRGVQTREVKGISISIRSEGERAFRIFVEGTKGRRVFASELDARRFAFDQLENGKLRNFVRGLREARV